MDLFIKTKLSNVIRNEAKNLLAKDDLENRLNDLDDLYILRRVVENFEEIESNLREFFSQKDKEEKGVDR
jgi:hypothetical protein